MIKRVYQSIYSLPVFWSVFLIGILFRILYHFIGVVDFWGDSYHNVYISWLTVENDWIYSDYAGREVVWLPFYRYLSGLLMFLFDSYSLEIAYVLNSVLSALCCGMVGVLVVPRTNKKFGLYAGIILGLLPWYLAYSHMNMPEILSSLILVLMLYVWEKQKYQWLLLIAFVGVLTRSEVTFVMMVFGVILLLKKQWNPAFYLALGSVIGLLIWGYWCYSITGEFFWWINERIVGSTWVNFYQRSHGYGKGAWYHPFVTIFISFPFIVLMIAKSGTLYRFIKKEWHHGSWFSLALAGLLFIHWIFLFTLQYRVIGYPDPKYYVVTLPIAIILLFIWLHHWNTYNRALNSILIFTIIFLIGHLVPFYYMNYSDFNATKVAGYLKANPPGEGNIWMDFTSTWYQSGISAERIYSSKQITPRERTSENFESIIENNMILNDIRYIMAAPASFTYVLNVFPQMDKSDDFTWRGFRIHQLYKFDPLASSVELNAIERMAISEQWASFWEVTYVEEQ